ncbi:MAG: hypothetical protein LBG72_03130 [Spirochaetaceae bacterium]|jgi:hypothetical protein|nr:hypothetical protein [Spirochaetaceae bacterium]
MNIKMNTKPTPRFFLYIFLFTFICTVPDIYAQDADSAAQDVLPVSQNQFQKRNFYVDAGAGIGANYYSFYDVLNGKWELEHSFFISASAGYSPFLQWMYVTMSFMYSSETNTLLEESISFKNITLSGGLRLYPFSSRKYFQAGIDAGISFADISSTSVSVVIPANTGTGFTVTCIFAYDVSRHRLGPSVQVGSQASFTLFNSGWTISSGIFAKLALKGLRSKTAPVSIVDDTTDMVLAFPIPAMSGSAVACWWAYRSLAYGDRSHAP